ncbi:MAG: hypothetical protein CMN30_05680 [Sandaracinus sp.]|nr:hypothetical protein [Sandaracinus sp.]|tara:strand:+ start:1276 stop:1941 length:666 start_codon:yes stop_codon:yes gene_type:complete
MRALAGFLFLYSLLFVFPGGSAPVRAQDSTAQARELFGEGTQAYQEGDFQRAAEKFEAAYRLTRSPELAFNVGRAYERMSEYDKAIRYFRLYLRQRDLEESVRADIAARVEALRQAKLRQRDQVFTLPPSDDALVQEARTFFQRGVAMFRRRQYEAAMQAFTAAHRFAPLPEIFFNMAVTAEKMGSLRDAMDYYREYLRLRPSAADRGHVEREIERLRAAR